MQQNVSNLNVALLIIISAIKEQYAKKLAK